MGAIVAAGAFVTGGYAGGVGGIVSVGRSVWAADAVGTSDAASAIVDAAVELSRNPAEASSLLVCRVSDET